MVEMGTDRLLDYEGMRGEGILEVIWSDAFMKAAEAMQRDLELFAQGHTIICGWGGIFTVSRASDSCECGRLIAKVPPILFFSVTSEMSIEA